MDWAFDITLKNRLILRGFLNDLTLERLNEIPDGFTNNIIWNIYHTLVTQQILVYTLSGLTPLINDDLIATYRKGTRPIARVDQLNVDFVNRALTSTVEKTKKDYVNGCFETYTPYTTSTKSTLNKVEDAIEFNNFHEGIHLGYILALRKSI